MDCEMPIMDGLTASLILKEKMKTGELPKIPIIGLSGNQDKDITAKTSSVGMDDYVLKPLTEGRFKSIITKFSPHLSNSSL